jgi:endonuclease III
MARVVQREVLLVALRRDPDPLAEDALEMRRAHLHAPAQLQLPYATIKEIFARFAAAEPEPKGELEHVNAFTLVVAVALSAQATDAGVNKATRALFKVADTPEKMLALGEEGVTEHIKTIGLYRNKAKNVIKLSGSWWRSMAARCRPRAPRCRRCPVSGARPPTSC